MGAIPEPLMESIARLKDAQEWKAGLGALIKSMLADLSVHLEEILLPYIEALGSSNVKMTCYKESIKVKVFDVLMEFSFKNKVTSRELCLGYRTGQDDFIPIAYYNNNEKKWQFIAAMEHAMASLYDFDEFGKECLQPIIEAEVRVAVDNELDSL